MRHLLDTLGGLWQLLRLFALSRFRLRGPYWRWRLETAFGHQNHKSRWQTFISLVEYGRWVHRMRKK